MKLIQDIPSNNKIDQTKGQQTLIDTALLQILTDNTKGTKDYHLRYSSEIILLIDQEKTFKTSN